MQNDQAVRFLKLLDPDADSFTFQADPEIKGENPDLTPFRMQGSLSKLLPRLTGLNAQKCEISVLGHDFKSGCLLRMRGVWRTQEDGVGGRFPLAPTMIVATSPRSFQHCWVVSEPLDNQDWLALMYSLIENYAFKGTAAIRGGLKLPGFYSYAGKWHPAIVEASGPRYSPEVLLKEFLPTNPFIY